MKRITGLKIYFFRWVLLALRVVSKLDIVIGPFFPCAHSPYTIFQTRVKKSALVFLQYAAICTFFHKHLQFTKENVRCILHAYQAPQELYRLLPASGFQFPGCLQWFMCKHCNIFRLWHEWVPSSYKVQICSLFSASTRSFISLSLKYIISAYDVVNIKCHNVVLSLNSKMDINLEGSVHCWVELQTCSSISLFGSLCITHLYA